MLNTVSTKKPKSFEYEFIKLSESDAKWYGSPYLIRVTNYSWFPTELLMTIIKGIYVDGNGIGANQSGNMGSASIGVKNIVKARELLMKK